jgi:hypothetical protein
MALTNQEQRALARIEFNLAFDDPQRVHDSFMRIVRNNPEVLGDTIPNTSAIPAPNPDLPETSSWLFWLMLVGLAMASILAGFSGGVLLGVHHEIGLWP